MARALGGIASAKVHLLVLRNEPFQMSKLCPQVKDWTQGSFEVEEVPPPRLELLQRNPGRFTLTVPQHDQRLTHSDHREAVGLCFNCHVRQRLAERWKT